MNASRPIVSPPAPAGLATNLTIEARITQAKLKPRLRALALHLLRCANADGCVGMSVRDMYLSISGTEPGPGGFVEVNYDEVGKAIRALAKARILAAYVYSPLIQSEVVMRFAGATKEG